MHHNPYRDLPLLDGYDEPEIPWNLTSCASDFVGGAVAGELGSMGVLIAELDRRGILPLTQPVCCFSSANNLRNFLRTLATPEPIDQKDIPSAEKSSKCRRIPKKTLSSPMS